jgi:hypothetical protein
LRLTFYTKTHEGARNQLVKQMANEPVLTGECANSVIALTSRGAIKMTTSSIKIVGKTAGQVTGWNRASAISGAILWLFSLFPLSEQLDLPVESSGETWLIERLLLLSILVCAPLTLRLTANQNGPHPWPWRAAVLIQPFAALLVAVSFYTRTGLKAGMLALPWSLATVLIALFGLWRLRQRRSFAPIEELCIDAGLAYVTVGGGWLFLSRCGLNPVGFSDTIVLLTATHFHYAGFAAPILTGLAGRKINEGRPSLKKFFRIAAAGVIAGPPMVAAGITFSRAIEMFSAFALAASLMLLALLILFAVAPGLKNRGAQLLLIVSANAVIVAMIFASVYALGRYKGITTVTIPLMAQVHGLSNAFGFVLCGLLAWLIEFRKR